jgi:protein TonB
MHIRALSQASLIHGALILGVGFGVQPFLVTERPTVHLKMQLEEPAPVILEELDVVEFVLDEFVQELEFEEFEVSEAPLEELRPSEPVDEAEPEREVEPRFAVPPRLRPSPDLLVRVRPATPRPPVPQPEQVVEAVAEAPPAPSESPAEPADDLNQKPVYPSSARRRGVEADVVLLVRVNSLGEVSDVQLLKSAGLTRAHKDMNESAIAAVVQWRYRPATRNGMAVEACLEVPVLFRLRR